jgi:hypothetical protein
MLSSLLATLLVFSSQTVVSATSPSVQQVYQWTRAPSLADAAAVYPPDFPENLQSFGSIRCVLSKERQPENCVVRWGGDPRLSNALLKLVPKFQGPPPNISTGATFDIVYYFRSADQIVGPPRFVKGPDDLEGTIGKWGAGPTLQRIAELWPTTISGAFFGGVECKVGPIGALEQCHIFHARNPPTPHCYGNGRTDGVCTEEQLRRFIPAPELTKLARAVRAPAIAPDGTPSTGWTVRFSVSLFQPLAPPMLISAPPMPVGAKASSGSIAISR